MEGLAQVSRRCACSGSDRARRHGVREAHRVTQRTMSVWHSFSSRSSSPKPPLASMRSDTNHIQDRSTVLLSV
eukprot:3552540-Rhodomonas_salina.1